MNQKAEVTHQSFKNVMSTQGLFKDLKSKQPIYIPAYQRGYEWLPTDCFTLIDSILDVAFENLNDEDHRQDFYPSNYGSFDDRIAHERGHEISSWQFCVDKVDQKNLGVKVIDGQQRLTTLLLMSRALLMTLCRLYDNPQMAKKDLVEDKEEQAAQMIISSLREVLSAHNPHSSDLGEWCQIRNGAIVNTLAIGDLEKQDFLDILQSGRTVGPYAITKSRTYANNYRFFLTVFAHPEWESFIQRGRGEVSETGLTTDSAKVEDVSHLSDLEKRLFDLTKAQDAKIQFDMHAYDSTGSSDKIEHYRNLFYNRIDENWLSPEQSGFDGDFDSSNHVCALHECNDGKGLPLILYFAFTMLHNLNIILHKLPDEKSALKHFYLTNNTGYPLPREKVLRAEFYEAFFKGSDSQEEGMKEADEFVADWNVWEGNLRQSLSSLPEGRLAAATKDALNSTLAYLNVTQIAGNRLDGPPGDYKKYSLDYWSSSHMIDVDHVHKVQAFLGAFNQVSRWVYAGKETADLTRLIKDDVVAKRVQRYLQALTFMNDFSVLQPVYIYLVHYLLKANQGKRPKLELLRFLEKHVANVLYRNVVSGLSKSHSFYAPLNIIRDICGAVYDVEKKQINERVGEFEQHAYLSMAAKNNMPTLVEHDLTEVKEYKTYRSKVYDFFTDQIAGDGIVTGFKDASQDHKRFVLFLLEILEDDPSWGTHAYVTSNAGKDRLLRAFNASNESFDRNFVQVAEIEHICAQSTKQSTVDKEVFKQYADKLGNLILLGSKENAKASDQTATGKKESYQNSAFPVARKLASEQKLLAGYNLENASHPSENPDSNALFDHINKMTEQRAEKLAKFFEDAFANYWVDGADKVKRFHRSAPCKENQRSK